MNSMKEITTREATESDLEVLLRFEQGVISAEQPLDPTLKQGAINYYDLPEMLRSPDIHLVVAESGNELLGCGYARIEKAKHYLRHPLHAYVGFMYTDPAHRGKGVNGKIIGALKQWALSKNITEMCLDVYHNNPSAISAYEKAGFTKHLINMRMGI